MRLFDYIDLQNTSFCGRISTENINNIYLVGKEMGSGKFGVVKMAAKKSFQNQKFALKSISRDRINTDVQMLERELDILMRLDHPTIMNLNEVYMDENFFHFVTQICEGGELFDHI